jgi:hypothetical protein
MDLATDKGGNVQKATLKLVQFEKSATTLLVRMLTFFHGPPVVFL